ncbi:MAG: hypothetical protein Q8P67_27895, partial [archaeon]|nr:hypothetical protein [archaeon]
VPYMAEQYRSYTLKLKLWDMPRTHFQFITRLDVKGKGRIFMVDMRKSPEWALPHPDYARRQDPSFQAIQASGPGINCVSVCQQLGKRCAADHFDFLNSCAALKAAFGCPKGCHMEWGGDLPALVIGPTNPRKGICMVVETPDVTGCGGSHAQTVRLCPCVG